MSREWEWKTIKADLEEAGTYGVTDLRPFIHLLHTPVPEIESSNYLVG